MPSIRARMSGSSSTIRISCAMRAPHAAIRPNIVRFGLRAAGTIRDAVRPGSPRQGEYGTGASMPPGFRLGCRLHAHVFQPQPASVVLHDLLHDGKAEPGALGLVGNIGL